MVRITINGVQKEREFQNMAQALAFAYQNGECYNAERIGFAYAATKKEAAGETEQKAGEKPVGTAGGTGGSAAEAPKPAPASSPGKPGGGKKPDAGKQEAGGTAQGGGGDNTAQTV